MLVSQAAKPSNLTRARYFGLRCRTLNDGSVTLALCVESVEGFFTSDLGCLKEVGGGAEKVDRRKLDGVADSRNMNLSPVGTRESAYESETIMRMII